MGRYELAPNGYDREDRHRSAEDPYESDAHLSPARSVEMKAQFDLPSLPGRFFKRELYVGRP